MSIPITDIPTPITDEFYKTLHTSGIPLFHLEDVQRVKMQFFEQALALTTKIAEKQDAMLASSDKVIAAQRDQIKNYENLITAYRRSGMIP